MESHRDPRDTLEPEDAPSVPASTPDDTSGIDPGQPDPDPGYPPPLGPDPGDFDGDVPMDPLGPVPIGPAGPAY